jgi:hypothetical protein
MEDHDVDPGMKKSTPILNDMRTWSDRLGART